MLLISKYLVALELQFAMLL